MDDIASCFKDKEIQKIIEQSEGKDVVDIPKAVGVQVVLKIANVVMKNLPSIKGDLYAFLASLTGMTEKDIAELPMGTCQSLFFSALYFWLVRYNRFYS